jgi:di/tricarboxylate transporter
MSITDSQAEIIEVDAASGSVGAADTDQRTPNTVALIGFILLCVSLLMCIWLFWSTGSLPDDVDAFRQQTDNMPAQMRLVVLACASGVLNLVALILCFTSLFLRNRTRVLAVVGTLASLTLLLGVFGVLIVGIALQPENKNEVPAVRLNDLDEQIP